MNKGETPTPKQTLKRFIKKKEKRKSRTKQSVKEKTRTINDRRTLPLAGRSPVVTRLNDDYKRLIGWTLTFRTTAERTRQAEEEESKTLWARHSWSFSWRSLKSFLFLFFFSFFSFLSFLSSYLFLFFFSWICCALMIFNSWWFVCFVFVFLSFLSSSFSLCEFFLRLFFSFLFFLFLFFLSFFLQVLPRNKFAFKN